MHGDPVAQPVLDVPEKGVGFGKVVSSEVEAFTRNSVLPARNDSLIGNANGAVTRGGNIGLSRRGAGNASDADSEERAR